MADQSFDLWKNAYSIDLHGVFVSQAIDILERRLETCYEFGIQFLDVVHGRSQSAEDKGKNTIRQAVLRDSWSGNHVRKKVHFNGKMERCDYEDCGLYNCTATRLCLDSNTVPVVRSGDFEFDSICARYPDIKSAAAIRPFLSQPMSLQYLTSKLFPAGYEPGRLGRFARSPMSAESYREIVDSVFTPVASSQDDIYPGPHYLVCSENLEQFRRCLIEKTLTGSQVADAGGFPEEWVEWCHQLIGGKIAADYVRCHCREMGYNFWPLYVYTCNDDGELTQPRIDRFSPYAVGLFRELWERFGTFSLVRSPYGAYPSVVEAARVFCEHRGCECPSNSDCRGNRKINDFSAYQAVQEAAPPSPVDLGCKTDRTATDDLVELFDLSARAVSEGFDDAVRWAGEKGVPAAMEVASAAKGIWRTLFK